jgi:RNA polymerase sigma-70 factor (ECF subfamily)
MAGSEADMTGTSGRSGDIVGASSFADMAARHQSVLLAVALREAGPSQAADVVQDTLMRAWERRETFDQTKGSERAWLIAILLDRIRRQRRRRLVLTATRPVYDLTADVDVRIIVEAAVSKLPKRRREVVLLYYLADFTVKQTASLLGITEGAVKTHLHLARRQLQNFLEIQ